MYTREAFRGGGEHSLTCIVYLGIQRWEGPLVLAREKLAWEEKKIENRYYMLLPGEIHPSEAENLACVRHRVANIGRQKELITRKTRVTEGSARAASRGV